MSLVNVYMEGGRALVSFDTLSSVMPVQSSVADAIKHLTGNGAHMTKCDFLACPNVAMAHRGDAMFASLLLHSLHMAALPDFDAIAENMQQLMAHVYAQVTEFRRNQFQIADFPGAEIVLVGWSPALNRMQGVRWVRWPQDKGFNASQVGKALLLPDAEWEQTPEAPDTPEKMEAIARDQVAYVRRKHPGYNCGGRLLLAELTRDSLGVRTIADLESEPASA